MKTISHPITSRYFPQPSTKATPISETTSIKASSFTSPKVSTRPWHIQAMLLYSHDSLKSSVSRMLLDRYLSRTSNEFGKLVTSATKNPFVDYVIPLALSKELFMNCVLAAAGSVLCLNKSVEPTTKSATWSHYSLVVRDLQSQLSKHNHEDLEANLHLLLIVMVLLMIEVCVTITMCQSTNFLRLCPGPHPL
jgi:hypothetical protein